MSESSDSVVEPKQPGCLSLIAGATSAVAALPLILFVASQFGRYSFLCELISNFQLFIFFSLLPFPFLLVVFRKWWWAVILGMATIASASQVLNVYLPNVQPPAGDMKIRLMTYNVLGANRDHEAAIKNIVAVDPDVIAVIEYSRPWHIAMEVLDERYPHSVKVPRWHGFGIAIFSKLPIESRKVYQLAPTRTDNPALVCQVKVGKHNLNIAALHVLSPTNRTRMKLRNRQFEEMGEILKEVDGPTVLVGDFNCTTWSPFLKRLMQTGKLFDSRRGFGYQATWSVDLWPIQIPIDHVLVSNDIHVHSRTVGENGGSDHYPVFCDISISDP